jgi:hypothetical protein
MNEKEATSLVLARFKVDLHDFLAEPSHPHHGLAIASRQAALRIMQTSERIDEIRRYTQSGANASSPTIMASRAIELAAEEGALRAWTEALDATMFPLLPKT